MSTAKKIGVLTGGGDCPGLNAVIRAVTKTAIIDYGMDVLGIEDGYEGLVEGRARPLSYETVSGILTEGGTILGTSNVANPYRYPRERGEEVMYEDVSDRAMANCRTWELDALVCIGGDGTLSIANRLHRDGLPIVGVPKTIDNDLSETDITFGFDTAVTNAAEAIDKIHTTAQSHHRAMVIETMGRYAGWIALTAGVAAGGDIILIPEIPYEPEALYQRVRERSRLGKRFSIIVVAEGAKPRGGDMVVKKRIEKSTDPVRLGGICNVIAGQIEERTGIEARVTILGHLQRGGTPTPFDRILATRFGTDAVHLAAEGGFGEMVCLRGQKIETVEIARAVARQKLVPPDCPLIASAKSVGTSFGI